MTLEQAKKVRIGDTLYCITDDEIVELEVVCVSDGYIITCLNKNDRESSLSMGCKRYSNSYKEILQVQRAILLKKQQFVENQLKINERKLSELQKQ